MACVSFSVVFFLSFLLILSSPTNSFEVTNTRSPLRTRTGCKVVLTCGGYGQSIEWRKFGELHALDQNMNQTTNIVTINPDNVSVPYLIANVTIIALPALDNVRFQCFVFGSLPEGRTVSHQVQLKVDDSVVDIVPEIPEVNISTYRVNSKVTIGCPVQTCAEQVHVQFLKGVSTISTIEAVSGETASVYNLVLDVTETARGRYACKVDTTNPDASTMMEFEVVGTPLPALTTDPPSTTGTSTTTSTVDTPTGSRPTGTQDTGNDNKSAAVVPRVALYLAVMVTTAILLLL